MPKNTRSYKDEKTDGIYHLITFPNFYAALQNFLGAKNARERFSKEWVCSTDKLSVLDVGCGPGELRPYLDSLNYLGIDLNAAHIMSADSKMGSDNTTFRCGSVQDIIPQLHQKFDRIILSGILHHLNDLDAKELVQLLSNLLEENGYIAVIEPVLLENQRPIARFMKSIDSGQHIRTEENWRLLFKDLKIESKFTSDLLRLPYDHIWLKMAQKRCKESKANHDD